MPTLHLEVPKIKCGGCANTIQETLSKLGEVRSVSVDVEKKTVAVTVEEAQSDQKVREALRQAGFPPA